MTRSGNRSSHPTTRAVRGAGLILWKGGVWIFAGYLLYESVVYLIGLMNAFDVPLPPRSGIALIFAGTILVVLSLVFERIRNGREQNLKDP